MRKALWFPLCMLFILASCSKSAQGPAPGTIVADIDGATKTFNLQVEAQEVGSNSLYVSGYLGDTASQSYSIVININSSQAITKGTYHFSEADPDNSVLLNYSEQPSDFDYLSDSTITNPSTVTISSISSTNVQGSFSGFLVGTDNRTRNITNGRFNVNF